MSADARGGAIRYGSSHARWILAATVLASGVAFLDGTVVNVALAAIRRDLDTSTQLLQWTVDAYLVTLTSLLLLGGSLGDRYGRRTILVIGLAWFVVASLLCGIAPTAELLVAARALQGVGAALLVPGSLAIISSSFHADDRGRAVGAWAGLAGVTTAIGPFVGGWLIDTWSWRLIFFINVPIALPAAWIALRHVPDDHDPDPGRLDLAGGAIATVGLAAIAYGVIERGVAGAVVGLVGVVALVAFVLVERRRRAPMLPLELFRSRSFTGANLTTLAVYAALGGALFLVTLRLQVTLGYSALEAGAAFVPLTVMMLALSSAAGQLAQRIGARLPMTIGPLLVAAGLELLAGLERGSGYVDGVLPGVLVFGSGLVLTVAPLTATVLDSADERHAGVASGFNNAVARLAGLLAVAALPAVAGISSYASLRAGLHHGYDTALHVAAVVSALGAVSSFVLVGSRGAGDPASRAEVTSAGR